MPEYKDSYGDWHTIEKIDDLVKIKDRHGKPVAFDRDVNVVDTDGNPITVYSYGYHSINKTIMTIVIGIVMCIFIACLALLFDTPDNTFRDKYTYITLGCSVFIGGCAGWYWSIR